MSLSRSSNDFLSKTNPQAKLKKQDSSLSLLFLRKQEYKNRRSSVNNHLYNTVIMIIKEKLKVNLNCSA